MNRDTAALLPDHVRRDLAWWSGPPPDEPGRRPAVTKAMVLSGEQVRITFPVLKSETTPDGDIVVYGCVTDGTVDADHQIVNPAWSGEALQKWLDTGGNLRVQHSPFLYPAGRGLEVEIDKDGDGGHWLRALVVEETAKKLVRKGVLKDFSIGVVDPVIRGGSWKAPGGEITGGSIGEVSLVDRGSNKNSSFTIAKAAADGTPQFVGKFAGAVRRPSPPVAAVPLLDDYDTNEAICNMAWQLSELEDLAQGVVRVSKALTKSRRNSRARPAGGSREAELRRLLSSPSPHVRETARAELQRLRELSRRPALKSASDAYASDPEFRSFCDSLGRSYGSLI